MYANHAVNEQNTTIFRTHWKPNKYINKYVSNFILIDICYVLYLYILKDSLFLSKFVYDEICVNIAIAMLL